MDLLAYLQHEFRYDSWANREEARVLASLTDPPDSAVKLLNHIVAAQWLWLDRLQQRPQRTAVWPELSLADCGQQLQELEGEWQRYLRGLDGKKLAADCSYRNSKGEAYTSKVLDILTQLIVHAAHHRGQIALEIRCGGNVPAPTDYIHAVRQGLLQ
jgi:uncharacterized damage-inducible protein DinB